MLKFSYKFADTIIVVYIMFVLRLLTIFAMLCSIYHVVVLCCTNYESVFNLAFDFPEDK